MSGSIQQTLLTLAALAATPVAAQSAGDPDAQARSLEDRMTPEERVLLTHGIMALPVIPGIDIPKDAVPGAGYVAGVPRLSIPSLKETDASLGVAWVSGMRKDGATALPSAASMGSTWNVALVRRGGAMIGAEAAAKGFNVMLAGGINLVRDPRNGRNFEYFGEDPLHSGLLGGAAVQGIQSNNIISTVKHFAINAQETGRHALSSRLSDRAMRESDLLAFEIAIETGRPGAVMCAYNRVNGDYACENDELLNGVLKGDWKYPGFVMSDWGAVHSLDSALNGLDQQSGSQLDPKVYFAKDLADAAIRNPRYKTRLSDMNRRIIRSMAASGMLMERPRPAIDVAANAQIAQEIAEEGTVLLRNRGGILPLASTAKSIAVIGGLADVGVISGGGSSQVAGPDGPAAANRTFGEGPTGFLNTAMYHRSLPLAAIRARAKGADVQFDDGRYVSSAVDLAKRSDIAVVFVTQWMMEGYDVADLSLPNGQDALVAAVAAVNPNTIVVLETGGPVAMPWLNQTAAVLQSWYPGARGGEAISRILFGDVNPSGRLPVTFPASLKQLPRPELTGKGLAPETLVQGTAQRTSFDVDYDVEGSDVGYRWFARKGLKPLFPFGYGLSYSAFKYGQPTFSGGRNAKVRFTVTNTSDRAGQDVPQFYLLDDSHMIARRLLGWKKIALRPGQTAHVEIAADLRLVADWDEKAHGWSLRGGSYPVAIATSAESMAAIGTVTLKAARLRP